MEVVDACHQLGIAFRIVGCRWFSYLRGWCWQARVLAIRAASDHGGATAAVGSLLCASLLCTLYIVIFGLAGRGDTIGPHYFPVHDICLGAKRPVAGRQLECISAEGLPFLFYLPLNHSYTGPAWPVIMFLHGATGRGSMLLSDGELTIQGPPLLASMGSPLLNRFVVISPQCGVLDDWTGSQMLEHIMALVTALPLRYNLDHQRIYLTGVSFGGFGTWALGAILANVFAAIVPVAGGGDPASPLLPNLRRTPIWAFHGANDAVVEVQFSDNMVYAVLQLGNPHVRYTRYEKSPAYEKYPDMIGHNAAKAAYETPELYDWLLQFKSNFTPNLG